MIRPAKGCLRPAAVSLVSANSVSSAAFSSPRGELQHRISRLLLTHSHSRTSTQTPSLPQNILPSRRYNHQRSATDEWMRQRGIQVPADEPEQSSSSSLVSGASSSAPRKSGKIREAHDEPLSGFFDRAIPLPASSGKASGTAKRIQARRRFLPVAPRADDETSRKDPQSAWESFSSLSDEDRASLPASELMNLWWALAGQDLGIQPSPTRFKGRAPESLATLLTRLNEIDSTIESRPDSELSLLIRQRILAAHRSLYIRNALSEQTSFYFKSKKKASRNLGAEVTQLVGRIHDLGFCIETGLLARLTRTLARQGDRVEALRVLERDIGPGGPQGRVELLPDESNTDAPGVDPTEALLKAVGELVYRFCKGIREAASKRSSGDRDRELHRALKAIQMAFSVASQGTEELLSFAIEAAGMGPTRRNEVWHLMDHRELMAVLPKRVSQEMEEQELPGLREFNEKDHRAPLWLDRVLSPQTKGHVAEEVCLALAAKQDLAPAVAYLRLAAQPRDDEERLLAPDEVMPPPPTSRLSFELISLLRESIGEMLATSGAQYSRKTSIEIDSAARLMMRVYADLKDAGIIPDTRCNADMIKGLFWAVRFGWRSETLTAEQPPSNALQQEEERPPHVSRLEETFNGFISAFVPPGQRQNDGTPLRPTARSTAFDHLLQLRRFTSSLLRQDPSLNDPNVVRPHDVLTLLELHVELLDAPFARRLFESMEAARLQGHHDEAPLFVDSESCLFLLRSAMQQRPRDVTFALRILSHALDPAARPGFVLPEPLAILLVSSVLRRRDSVMVREAWARLGEMGTELKPKLARTIVEALADAPEPNADVLLDVAEQLEHIGVSNQRETAWMHWALARALDASSRAFTAWTPARRDRVLSLFGRFRVEIADCMRDGGQIQASTVRMAYHAAARALIGEAALEVGHFDQPSELPPSPFGIVHATPEHGLAGGLLHELNVTLGIPPDYQTLGLKIVADIIPDRRTARERLEDLARDRLSDAASWDEAEPTDGRRDLFETPVDDERLDRAMQTFQSSLGAKEHPEGVLRLARSVKSDPVSPPSQQPAVVVSYTPDQSTTRILRLRSGIAARLVVSLGRSGRFEDAQYVYDSWMEANVYDAWMEANNPQGSNSEADQHRFSSGGSAGSTTRPLVGRKPYGLEGALVGILAMQGRSSEWRFRLARLQRDEGYRLTDKFSRTLEAWDEGAKAKASASRAQRLEAHGREAAGPSGETWEEIKGEMEEMEDDNESEETREMREVFRRLASGQPARRRP